MFQCECLLDLQAQLQTVGCSLHVVVGDSTEVVHRLVEGLSVDSVYLHDENMVNETKLLGRVRQRLGGERVVAVYDAGGLVPLDRLPFALDQLDSYSAFRKQVEASGLLQHPDLLPWSLPSVWRPALLAEHVAVVCVDLDASDLKRSVNRLWNELCLQLGELSWVVEAEDTTGLDDDERSAIRGLGGGETAAWRRLRAYCDSAEGHLPSYKALRNGLVGTEYSTKLSMYLAHGCLTARSVLDHLRGHLRRIDATDDAGDVARTRDSVDLLVLHLLWRDFMHLYAVSMGTRLFHRYGRSEYRPPAAPDGVSDGGGDGDATRWELFRRWQQGQTGYPFVDASMRELLATGYMSNRGRQNVASFLVNDLRVDWRWGAAHFERHLVDYDVAANYGNWQYLAGVGSDPRTTSGTATRPPVGRYFNIAKQALLYDPNATFMRMWCPELWPLCEAQAQRCGDGDAAAAAVVACYVDRRLLTALLQEAAADSSGRRIDYPVEPIAALAHRLDPVADLHKTKDDLVRRARRRNVKHGDIPLVSQAS